MAERYPLALAEMRDPSVAFGQREAQPVARWGIECKAGWRPIIQRLLASLDAAIAAEDVDRRPKLRINQIKEKFGRLVVYLAGEGTPAMDDAIRRAGETSVTTCDVCGEPGSLAGRRDFGWWSTRCARHENWSPSERVD